MWLTEANFDEEVFNSKIPVLVDFWGSWCIPSQMMKPIIDRLSEEYHGRVKIGKINVDQNPRVRAKCKVLGCPTIIIFKDSKEVVRKVGAQSDNQLRELIDSTVLKD